VSPFGSQFPFGFDFGRRRHHHFGSHFGSFPVFVPVYTYPYAYGYPGFYPETATPSEADFQQPEPEPPALTVFEHRSTYRPPPVDRSASRDYQRSEESTAAARERRDVEERATEPEEKVADQSPTILVFRDGHQLEIGNYAIQGDTIYNLGGSGPRKIKLSELDLGKTVRLNDERGNEFRLPKNFRG
jgi:hypothetical protein